MKWIFPRVIPQMENVVCSLKCACMFLRLYPGGDSVGERNLQCRCRVAVSLQLLENKLLSPDADFCSPSAFSLQIIIIIIIIADIVVTFPP
jgi:hypothetical protein